MKEHPRSNEHPPIPLSENTLENYVHKKGTQQWSDDMLDCEWMRWTIGK